MGKSGRYQLAIRGTVGGVVLVAALVAFFGPSQPGYELEQRAAAFWEARVLDDGLAAYQYETYAHSGEMTATQYVRALSPLLKYTDYTIHEIQEQKNEALVRVRVQYQLTIPTMGDVPLSMTLNERWVRFDDGRWYRNVQPAELGQAAHRQD